jgi:two-component system sensor histidine kinase AtoS
MYPAEVLNDKTAYTLKDEDADKDYFDATTTAVIYLDSELYIKNLNREAERICGIRRDQMLDRLADDVFRDYDERFRRVFLLPDNEDLYTTTLRLKIGDQTAYLHVDVLRLLCGKDRDNGIIVIMQDISAVHAAIKQIHTTQMLMSLGELAAGVAHHVRTPLTTISGYLQVMLGRLQNDQYIVRRDLLEVMLDEVSYINDVIKELVLFAKPPIKKQPGVNINQILEQALLLTFKEMGGENINIDKHLAKDLPVIDADANLVKQALMHIMQNAIEAMPDQGTIAVRSWLNVENNMLVIAISDTGTGMSQDVVPRIFEPFFTTKLDRTGLGLPIANRIIAEHGGFINISIDEAGGTRVHVYIPIFDDRVRRLTVIHQQILNLQ